MSLRDKRQRFMLRRCKRVKVSDRTLYHGSPASGLAQIRLDRCIEPQTHGLLRCDAFCVSVNDLMLHYFGREDEGRLTGRNSGLVFSGVDLNCLQLDWMHLALIDDAGLILNNDAWTTRDSDWELAERLGYIDYGQPGGWYLHEEDFLELLPDWVDALMFPWSNLEHYAYNDEAEISVLRPGCQKLLESVDTVILRGKELSAEEGWKILDRYGRTKLAS